MNFPLVFCREKQPIASRDEVDLLCVLLHQHICHLVSCYKKTKRRWCRPTVNVYLNFLCHLFFKQDKKKIFQHLVSGYKKTNRRWCRPTLNIYLNFLCHLFFKEDKRKKYFSLSYNQLIWLCRHEVEVKTYFAVTWSWSPRRIGAWWQWQHKAPGSPHIFTVPRRWASHVRMRCSGACRWFPKERRR
jgi:hypothetical protein